MSKFRSRPRSLALAVLGCAVVAGCGSTGAPSGTVTNAAASSGKGSDQALQFAQCMRAHGVSNFPDPTGGGIRITPSIAQSPDFKTAQSACKQYLPNGGQPPSTAPGERAAAVAFARCMRTHGVPDFPDPLTTVPSTPPAGRVAILDLHGMAFELGPTIDPASPAFQHAATDCGVRPPAGNKTPTS